MRRRVTDFYVFSVKEIAALCRVSLKTAKRWKAGTTCPPPAAQFLIRGDLGMFDPSWRGWIVRGGKLITPEGWETTPGDVMALPFMRQQIAVYQAENRKLRIPDIEDQPLPESWQIQIG